MIAGIRIEGTQLVATLNRVLETLASSQHILYEAMATVTALTRTKFTPPTTPAQYPEKLAEIKAILSSPTLLSGVKTAIRLMEEIYSQVCAVGGIAGASQSDILKQITFNTARPGEKVYLSDDLCWRIEWPVRSTSPTTDGTINCAWHSREFGTVVPPYVLNYISSAASAHLEGKNDVAMALLSIAVEATLRDVLAVRGYTFQHGVSAVDTFAFSDAEVSVDSTGSKYLIEFKNGMSLSPSDFSVSFPSSPVNVKIRRQIKGNSNPRVDLLIKAPEALLNHWSCDTVETRAAKSIGGLGAALDIARNQERCISPADLATDFDNVLKIVRNNLIHLSGNALSTRLTEFDERTAPRDFTMKDFLSDAELVYDFVVAIPRFITQQYLVLRSTGSLCI